MSIESDVTFSGLRSAFDWKEIRNCPGRYMLKPSPSRLTPMELIGATVKAREFRIGACRDPVIVATFSGGGLISYRLDGGWFIHTLNTAEGLQRKLNQLGLAEETAGIVGSEES